MVNTISGKIAKGFVWTSIDRFSTQFVQFIIGIVIARLITPHEYGVMGILLVFINISQVFIDSGLGSALIYRNNKQNDDLQTTFTFNLIISVALFVLLFGISPYIESFFHLDGLSKYMRVCIFVLLTNSLIVVPTAILKINLDFKALAISNVISTAISGILGVVTAYKGLGVWALIIQLLSKSVFQLLLIFLQCRWLPNLSFHKKSFKALYDYGVKLFGATCLTKIVDESTTFFIGKFLSPTSLGVFTRANQFASLPSTSFGTIVSSVLFPSFSSLKNDEVEFNRIFRKAVIYQAAISIPLFLWLAMLCEPLIRILLTEKWIAVVPVMQILCIGRCLSPVANISEQVLSAKGRSDLFLYQQFFKMGIKTVLVICALHFGLLAVACADAIYTLSAIVITCHYLRNINDFCLRYQLKAIRLYILFAVASAGAGYACLCLVENDFLKIIFSFTVAFSIYIMSIVQFQHEINLKLIINKFRKNK